MKLLLAILLLSPTLLSAEGPYSIDALERYEKLEALLGGQGVRIYQEEDYYNPHLNIYIPGGYVPRLRNEEAYDNDKKRDTYDSYYDSDESECETFGYSDCERY